MSKKEQNSFKPSKRNRPSAGVGQFFEQNWKILSVKIVLTSEKKPGQALESKPSIPTFEPKEMPTFRAQAAQSNTIFLGEICLKFQIDENFLFDFFQP